MIDDQIVNLGWLQSGDLGFYDEDGYVFIVDRLKEILKVKSHHVSPVEIEHVLMQHPGVEEAVVVGVPHETDIDHPIAFVTKAPGGQVCAIFICDKSSLQINISNSTCKKKI